MRKSADMMVVTSYSPQEKIKNNFLDCLNCTIVVLILVIWNISRVTQVNNINTAWHFQFGYPTTMEKYRVMQCHLKSATLALSLGVNSQSFEELTPRYL